MIQPTIEPLTSSEAATFAVALVRALIGAVFLLLGVVVTVLWRAETAVQQQPGGKPGRAVMPWLAIWFFAAALMIASGVGTGG